MESRKFDDLTKALASGTTRRGVLKGVVGGALGALGLSRTAGAQANKVNVCHLTDDPANPVVLISVSVNAIPAHESHGDVIDPDFSSDPNNCSGCGVVCSAPENATAACTEGECGFVCNEGYQPDGEGGCVAACSAETCAAPCFCSEAVEGGTYCRQDFVCGTMLECETSGDCGEGFICRVSGACGPNICAPLCGTMSAMRIAGEEPTGPTDSGN